MHAHQLRASERFKDSPQLLPLPTPPLFFLRKVQFGQVWCRERWVPCHSKRGGGTLPSFPTPGWPWRDPHQGGHAVGGGNAAKVSFHLGSASCVSAFSKQSLGKGQAGASPSQLAASLKRGFRVCRDICVTHCPSV